MVLRKVEPNELEAYKAWFTQAGDLHMLDFVPHATAFGVFDGETRVAIAFLVLTNAPYCVIDGMQTNHELSELTQGKGVKMLIDEMQLLGKSLGYKHCWGYVAEDHFTLARYYLRQGAIMGKKLMRIFYKYLEGE